MKISLENCNLPGPMNWLAFVICSDKMRDTLTVEDLGILPSAHGANAKEALERLLVEIGECPIPFDKLML